MKRIPQEVLSGIAKLLKKICGTNTNFADIIIDEINNPLIKSLSFNKTKEGFLIVKFMAPLSSLTDNFSEIKHDFKCELKISNLGFQYSVIDKDNRKLGKVTRKYTLRCKKDSELTNFSRETFYEHKTKVDGIPYSSIDASNEIDIFSSSQQVSHEENKVKIIYFPSHRGELYVKEELDKYGLKMKVTNPLALELLSRLEYNILSVESNHSEHSEIWPILENSVVQLMKKESINYDKNWDAYHNEQIMFVGNNKYENHKNLNAGAMYFTYGSEERAIAKKYFEGSISIEEVLDIGEKLLLSYEEEAKNFKKR